MKGLRSALVVTALLGLPFSTPARAQQPAPPAPSSVSGEAPIVGGNAASARQRAIDEARRQLVERALGQMLQQMGLADPLPPGVVQLRASLFSQARGYVRTYRVLSQTEEAGRYRVEIDGEVNEPLLRSAIERARAAGAPRPAVAAGSGAVMVGGQPADVVQALVRALGSAGLRVDPTGAPADEARAREAVGKGGHGGAVLVSGDVTPEGTVRGTAKQAASCRVAARLLAAGGGAATDRSTEARGFGDGATDARGECLARAAAELAPALAPSLGSSRAARRSVTLELDLIEPAAMPLLLQALRRTGGVSSSEVRRVAVGKLELRVSTSLPAGELLAALTRALGAGVLVTATQSTADRASAQVRMAMPQAPAAPAVAPAASP